MKYIYVAGIGLIAVLGIAGGVLCAVEQLRWGLLCLGAALALLPVVGHLRMRREVSAVKALLQRTVPDSADASKRIADAVAAIEKHSRGLAESVQAGTRDFSESADEIRERLEEAAKALERSHDAVTAKIGQRDAQQAEALAAYANELRRESRMLRLAASQGALRAPRIAVGADAVEREDQ